MYHLLLLLFICFLYAQKCNANEITGIPHRQKFYYFSTSATGNRIFINIFFFRYIESIGPFVKTTINYGNRIKFRTVCTANVINQQSLPSVRNARMFSARQLYGVSDKLLCTGILGDGQVTSKRVSSSAIVISKVLRYKILYTPPSPFLYY